MSPVKVELPLILIFCATPAWVSTMKGSKVVVAPVTLVVIVDAAAFVPHQLLVAVTVVPSLAKLLPAAAVLPASRLKLMLMGPAVGNVPADPVKIPPPFPAAVLLIIVTLLKLTGSIQEAGQPVKSITR